MIAAPMLEVLQAFSRCLASTSTAFEILSHNLIYVNIFIITRNYLPTGTGVRKKVVDNTIKKIKIIKKPNYF